MKFALMLFLSALVVTSQQFYIRSPGTPVFLFSPYSSYSPYSPYSSPYFSNNYRPLMSVNGGSNPNFSIASDESQYNVNGYPDAQSRIRGFSGKLQSSLDDDQQQSGRFLAALTSTSVDFTFYTSTVFTSSITSVTSTSTATITNTATLSLTSVVKCVPQFQVNLGAGNCARKKRTTDDSEDDQQFDIYPSKTLKLTPTAFLSNSSLSREIQEFDESILEETNDPRRLRSSQNEIENKETSAEEFDQGNLRKKRFFFTNRNFFLSTTTSTSVVTVRTTSAISSISTLTAFTTTTMNSYLFSNSTVTQTVNLITPIPAAQCTASKAQASDENCLSCLPAGYVVCGTAG